MRTLWLLVVLVLTSSLSRADQISDQVGQLRKRDPKLENVVTVWRPAICVGDLLEQAAEQTGAPVFAEDSDGAAGEIVCVYVKNQPLGDLMESLASLLSERGAVWEWRKSVGRKGDVRYRLVSATSKSQARLQSELAELYLNSLENAIFGNIENDEYASRLVLNPEPLRILAAITTPAERRDLILKQESLQFHPGQNPSLRSLDVKIQDDFELIYYKPLSSALPCIMFSNEIENPMIDSTPEMLRHIFQPALNRWKMTDDEEAESLPFPDDVKVWTIHPDDCDALDRFARCTGIPVLYRGFLGCRPRISGAPFAPISQGQFWKTFDSIAEADYSTWVRKARRGMLLVRCWQEDDFESDTLKLPWKFYREARDRIASAKKEGDVSRCFLSFWGKIRESDKDIFISKYSSLIPEYLFDNSPKFTIDLPGGRLESDDIERCVSELVNIPGFLESRKFDNWIESDGYGAENKCVQQLLNDFELFDFSKPFSKLQLRFEVKSNPERTFRLNGDKYDADRFITNFRLGKSEDFRLIEITVMLRCDSDPPRPVRQYRVRPGLFFFKPPP